ncbi:MAG: hypothetical protein CM1200mP13_02550 [Candidatus Pelagibacterales bacterium]|nr:MAG: hypothetical protein CM1200mP13_02550 [Pelagibacterales bacterium]
MGKISLEVNGRKVEKEAPDNTLLSTFLREHLQLKGTHIGCDTSQCGACVVHVDGNSLKSCTALAAELMDQKLQQLRGFETKGKMHPMQGNVQKTSWLTVWFLYSRNGYEAVDLFKKKKTIR